MSDITKTGSASEIVDRLHSVVAGANPYQLKDINYMFGALKPRILKMETELAQYKKKYGKLETEKEAGK